MVLQEKNLVETKPPLPKTESERKARQTEMKALSTLLLAIPNEYQHQFHKCIDAKILWDALEKRFSGIKSIKGVFGREI